MIFQCKIIQFFINNTNYMPIIITIYANLSSDIDMTYEIYDL